MNLEKNQNIFKAWNLGKLKEILLFQNNEFYLFFKYEHIFLRTSLHRSFIISNLKVEKKFPKKIKQRFFFFQNEQENNIFKRNRPLFLAFL